MTLTSADTILNTGTFILCDQLFFLGILYAMSIGSRRVAASFSQSSGSFCLCQTVTSGVYKPQQVIVISRYTNQDCMTYDKTWCMINLLIACSPNSVEQGVWQWMFL